MQDTKKMIVCLMGPTASGKTDLAVELVKRFPFEIISVDSAMIYRGMDIGTAKPSPDILKMAPHRLLDIRDPSESYSAAEFCSDATREIQAIYSQNKIPLLVGGTMLYFRALQDGLSDLPSANPEVRAKLNKLMEQHGLPFMHARLSEIDTIAAQRIHPNDAQRIQRALEVYEISGKTLTELQGTGSSLLSDYQIYNLAVTPERSILHERIALRFEHMLQNGFLKEVRSLFDRGDLNLDMPAIRSVGYRQVWEYFLEKSSYEEMCDKANAATRQLAKRQLTWLRHWSSPLVWFDSLDADLLGKIINLLKI